MAVTRKDVAKLAKVSEATVSYVINETKNVTPQVKKRVLDAVEKLDYRPNLLAKSLVTKETKHIAMLVDNMQNPYYCRVMEGVQFVAEQEGYIVSILSADYAKRKRMQELLARGVDGLVLALGAYDMREFFEPRLPTVSIDEKLRIDYRQAVFDMIKRLKELGHSKIAFLSGIPMQNKEHVRYHDFLDALENYGLQKEELLFVDGSGATNEEAGYAAMDVLLNRTRDFTAVFAVNDLMAIGAMRRMWKENIFVPGDVSIVGCDGISSGRYTMPALTTIDSYGFQLGKAMMKTLIKQIHPDLDKQDSEWVVHAKFQERESVGRAPTTN